MKENLYINQRKTDLVVLGLGKIGANLVQNFIKNTKYKIIIFDSDKEKVKKLLNLSGINNRLLTPINIENVFDNKKTNKIIFTLVPSGKISLKLHRIIKNLMHTNDIALNCCNESYLDSNLLAKEFIESKKNYLSTGISGGTLGARNGLAIMVGGQEKIYQNILPLLKKIAAFKNSKYSVNYFGEMGVGHLVKTLHNYLEYAEMQLITEKIIFLRICLGLSWNDIYKILQKNSTNKILDSYLLQITTGILKKISSDQEFYNSLLPIVDHNNSGLWGLNTSIETASFTPTLQISVMNRIWLNNFSSSNSKKSNANIQN